jgi:hypothetical protein
VTKSELVRLKDISGNMSIKSLRGGIEMGGGFARRRAFE